MNHKKKVCALVSFLIFIGVLLIAQPFDTKKTEDLLNESNTAYSNGRYERAYDIVNQALIPYRSTVPLPENVHLMAEAVYFSWLQQIEQEHSTSGFKKFVEGLKQNPGVISDRINKKVNQIIAEQESLLVKKRNTALKTNSEREWIFYDKLLEQHRKNTEELQKRLAVGFYDINAALIDGAEQSRHTTQFIYSLLVLFSVLFTIAAVTFLIVLTSNHLRRRRQQEQFELTLRVVASLKRGMENQLKMVSGGTYSISSEYPPAALTVLSGGGQKHPSSETEINLTEVRMLHKPCRQLGEQIDRYTLRKNNSRNVSELIYALCRRLTISEEKSLLYFYASMVYDAGFLSIDQPVLIADHLTVDERVRIRDHVQLARRYFDFIPSKYLPVFLDAAEKHHENMNGTGYEKGLESKEIPDVARLIRVAESYVSLTSNRLYRAPLDKDAAFNELNRSTGVYDPAIVAVLEEIV